MTLLVPTVCTSYPVSLATLFAIATFCYAGMANALPSDMFYSESVATVSGMGGTAAGLGTVIASLLIGHLSNARSAMGTASFDLSCHGCGDGASRSHEFDTYIGAQYRGYTERTRPRSIVSGSR